MGNLFDTLFSGDIFSSEKTTRSGKGGKRKDEYAITPADPQVALSVKDTAARLMRNTTSHKQTRMCASLVWASEVIKDFWKVRADAFKAVERLEDACKKDKRPKGYENLVLDAFKASTFTSEAIRPKIRALCQIKTSEKAFGNSAIYEQLIEAVDKVDFKFIDTQAQAGKASHLLTVQALSRKCNTVLVQVFEKPTVRDALFGANIEAQAVKVATMLAEMRIPECHLNANVRAKAFSAKGIKFGQIYDTDALKTACFKVVGEISHEYEDCDIDLAANWNNYAKDYICEIEAPKSAEISSDIDDLL